MPDLLADPRNALAEHPLVRDLIVLDRKSLAYGWRGPHLRLSADELPNLRDKVRVLENHGLLREIQDQVAYRMSDRLVKYLRRPQAG
jgi:hypothetical protein